MGHTIFALINYVRKDVSGMKKRLLSTLLAITLSLNMSILAFATNESSGESMGLTGYSESDMTIKNAEITLSTNAIRKNSSGSRTIDINPVSSSNLPSVTLTGEFYPFPNGVYEGSVVIGNFESSDNNTEVVQVRLSATPTEELPALDITVKNKQTGNEARTYGQIPVEEFSEIYAEAMNNYNRFLQENENDLKAYKDFLVSLALGEEFSTPVESDAFETEVLDLELSSTLSTRASKSALSDYTYTQLKNFMTALKNNNTITLSSYNISQDFLTNTGFDHVGDADYYAASKYTYDGGGGVYYTRLTLADLIAGTRTSSQEIYYQMQYSLGIMIEYIEGTTFARLYLDDYGLEFKNVHLKIDTLGPSTNNIFVSWEMSGSVTNSSYNVVALIALVDELSVIATAWDAYELYRTGAFDGGVVYFDDTIEEQVNRWGKVIRGIAFDSDNVYMDCEGQRMTLTGGYSINGTPTYSIGFKYTAST